jgi:hypothetical protein
MKRVFKRGMSMLALLGTLLGAAAYLRHGPQAIGDSADTLFLLLPDAADESEPAVQEWLDAANEEGLHLEIIRDSNFLDPMSHWHAAGLIVPDQVHRRANDALVGALNQYALGGGKLMLVYDACTWDLNGYFPELGSRLSDLAGVNYALYSQYGKKTMEQSPVWGTADAMEELEIPPGQFVPMDKHNRPSLWRETSLQRTTAATNKDDTARYTFAAYKYGEVLYPSFRTSGEFDGKVLLESNAGVVAGVHQHGQGDVLFVNLPLGYLESRTDGLFLHSFLRYFALRLLDLPYLASVPDGVGGLVLNWHVDDKRALKFLQTLRNAGIFDHGPFSVHLTAGPDVDRFHDGKGLNINSDAESQRWVQFFLRQGDEVGSHGGWIHNYFASNLPEHSEPAFESFLAWNKEAVERAGGKPVVEYSAPAGNHPEWVTLWLEEHGFVAYYFTGDEGMGPTMVYRDHRRDGSLWAFPILHLGGAASFEEFQDQLLSDNLVRQWLISITDFATREHVARLFYTHPVGATMYIRPLLVWMDYTGNLQRQGKFRWYTMTSLAGFLTARRAVQWAIDVKEHNAFLRASHPKTLEHETWIFPKSSYGALRVTQGKAEIRAVDDKWFITAGDCTHLQVRMEKQQPAGRGAPRS